MNQLFDKRDRWRREALTAFLHRPPLWSLSVAVAFFMSLLPHWPGPVSNELPSEGLASGAAPALELLLEEPTPLEALLSIVGVDYPTSETCGQFNVLMDLCIQNNGNTGLKNVTAELGLDGAGQFGAALVNVVDVGFIQSNATENPILHPGYDGGGDNDLFTGTSGLLEPGESLCVRIEVEIAPDAVGVANPVFSLQAEVGAGLLDEDGDPVLDEADAPVLVSDLSDDDTAFKGLEGNEDAPTIIDDQCWRLSQEMAGNDLVNIAVDSQCETPIYADMLIENHYPQCDDQAFPAGGFYRILLIDPLTGQTIWVSDIDGPTFNPSAYINRNIDYVVRSVAEYCRPVRGQINFFDESPPVVTCLPPSVDLLWKYFDLDGEKQFSPHSPTGPDLEDDNGVLPGSPWANFLVCGDVDKIYRVEASWQDPSYPYYTGFPEAVDACGEVELVSVRDVLQENDFCDEYEEDDYRYAVVERTFTFVDEAGNEGSCTQEINFRRPRILLPSCTVLLDRNLAAGDDELLPADLVDPEVYDQPFSVPFYINALNDTIYLTREVCNLSVSYSDQRFEGQDDCGYRIVRTWTIIDGCYSSEEGYPSFLGCASDVSDIDCYGVSCGNLDDLWDDSGTLEIKQNLIIGDADPPIVECAEPNGKVVSTGPYSCEASFLITRDDLQVIEASDWCFEVELVEQVPVLDINGLPTGEFTFEPVDARISGDCDSGYTVGGVPADGEYFLRYRVSDICWNRTTVICPLIVVDDTEPVAVCDDDLRVSLEGNGIALVGADDVDEGSWDACSEVTLAVRRQIGEDCLPSYTLAAAGATWPDDFERAEEEDEEVLDIMDGIAYFVTTVAFPERGIEVGDTLLMREILGTVSTFYSYWADEVLFTCCDITDPADPADNLMVELRVTDASGNSNRCGNGIDVEDKLPPRCSVSNATILCTELDFDPTDPEQVAARFGAPEEMIDYTDNCGATISEEITWLPGDCNEGTIIRAFTITDFGGRTTNCTQRIDVEKVIHYEVKFPGDDESVECGTLPESTIGTQVFGCDILAVSRDTVRYEAHEDECFKLAITYEVINWCEFDAHRDLEPTVIRRDIDADWDLSECTWIEVNYDDPEEAVQLFTRHEDAEFYLDSVKTLLANYTLEEYLSGRRFEGDEYIESFTPGFWQYTQLLKVYDTGAPEIEVNNALLEFCAFDDPTSEEGCNGGKVEVLLTVSDSCTPEAVGLRSVRLLANLEEPAIDPSLIAADFKIEPAENGQFLISGTFPLGEHAFVIQAADGCGNLTGETVIFQVVDCKSPAPICYRVLSVDLGKIDTDGDGIQDDAGNRVFAETFIAQNIDDCTPSAPAPQNVQYFIFRADELPGGDPAFIIPDSLNDNHRSVFYSCDDIGEQTAYVVALDGAGNFDYCETKVLIQLGNDLVRCGGGSLGGDGNIAGLIVTEDSETVEDVEVQLSGLESKTMMTANDGHYGFGALEQGYDYSIQPYKDDGYLNGVSTFDLVLISKHILGVKLLDSPYKLIAADINNSASLTTLDLIQLRKMILGIDPFFRNNTSWRFVAADYEFMDPLNPWGEAFPEVYNINDLLDDRMNADFVAIKVGDVNSNAKANRFGSTRPRSAAAALYLNLEERELRAGDTYRVAFRSDQLADIEGCQFTLHFDASALSIADLEYGLATEEHLGLRFLDEGALTASWNPTGAATSGEVLFTLVFRALKSGRLSEQLHLSSRITNAEAYDRAGALMEVGLRFSGKEAGDTFELYQNYPNPFSEKTLISFLLPEAARATVRIQDLNGRVLKAIERDFDRGYNELRIERHELPARGVLYYSLETGDYYATRKMIVLE